MLFSQSALANWGCISDIIIIIIIIKPFPPQTGYSIHQDHRLIIDVLRLEK